METSFHLRSLDAVSAVYAAQPARPLMAKVAQEEVAFENARALTRALHDTPSVREDLVRRATELVGDVNYPPPETIRMISHLLAIQMESEGDLS
jgi:hypothetical protein